MAVQSKLFHDTFGTQTADGRPSCMASDDDHLLQPKLTKQQIIIKCVPRVSLTFS